MTGHYLTGELPVRLERLQAVAAGGEVRDVARLRYEVENGGTGGLGPAAARVIELCRSGVCARLLGDG